MFTELENIGLLDTRDPVNWQHPLNHGLMALWLGLPDLSAGNIFYDLAGRNNGVLTGMTIAGSTGWVPSTRMGGSSTILCNGSTDVVVPSSAALSPSVALTCCAWAYFTNAGATSCILSKDSSTNTQSYMLKFSGGTSNMVINGTHGASGVAVTIGTWAHLVGTYDGANIKIYTNGVLSGTTAYVAAIAVGVSTVQIGGRENTASRQFLNGGVDDVRFYNRALSAQEIYELYTLSMMGNPGVLNRISGRMFSVSPKSWSMSEAYPFSDGRIINAAHPVSDSYSIADNRIVNPGKPLPESYSLLDTGIRTPSKPLPESYIITDTRKNSPAHPLLESYTLSDARLSILSRILLEALPYTDTRAPQIGIPLNDAYSLTDTRIDRIGKSVSDFLSYTDAIGLLKDGGWLQLLSDSYVLTDSRANVLQRSLLEVMSYVDSRTNLTGLPFPLSLSFLDSIVETLNSGGKSMSLTEGYSLTDVKSFSTIKNAVESLILNDVKAAGFIRLLADTYNLTDMEAGTILVLTSIVYLTYTAGRA